MQGLAQPTGTKVSIDIGMNVCKDIPNARRIDLKDSWKVSEIKDSCQVSIERARTATRRYAFRVEVGAGAAAEVKQ